MKKHKLITTIERVVNHEKTNIDYNAKLIPTCSKNLQLTTSKRVKLSKRDWEELKIKKINYEDL